MPLDPHITLISTFAFYVIALIAGILIYKKYTSPALEFRGGVSTLEINKIDLLGIALIIGFVSLNLIPAFTGAGGEDGSATKEMNITPGLLLIGMIAQAVPGLIVIVLLVARGTKLIEFFGLSLRWKNILYLIVIAPLGVIYTFLFMWGLNALGYSEWLVQVFGQEVEVQDAIRIYQETDEVIIRILMAISVVIIAPIIEEMVFRGYIYTVTKRYTARIFSTLISAVLFGVVHNYIPGLVPLAFLAVLLTISYEITGSLWAPISIHALFNASTLLVQEIQFHHS